MKSANYSAGPGPRRSLAGRSLAGRSLAGRSRQSGSTLIELLTIVAIVSILLAMAMPALSAWAGVAHVRLAAGEVASRMSAARMYAVRYSTHVALSFEETDAGLTMALYRDTNGNGVLRRDIKRGIDVIVQEPRTVAMTAGRVRFGFPAGMAPMDPSRPGRRLTGLDDPIRFNQSDMASFGPRGSATPGTVYLTANDRFLAAVRVQQGLGRITILLYDRDKERWERAF